MQNAITLSFLKALQERLPQVYLIPEGVEKVPWACGVVLRSLMKETRDFDIITCAAGTGTTAAGMLIRYQMIVRSSWCFPALKGGKFLEPAIERWLLDYQLHFSTSLDEKKLLEQAITHTR